MVQTVNINIIAEQSAKTDSFSIPLESNPLVMNMNLICKSNYVIDFDFVCFVAFCFAIQVPLLLISYL